MANDQSIPSLKRCQKCAVEKPSVAFSACSKFSDGRQKTCKCCMSAYRKTDATRASDRARHQLAMATEPERIRARRRAYASANPEKVRAWAREQAAKPSNKAKRAAWIATDRRLNPAKHAAISKRYRKKNQVKLMPIRRKLAGRYREKHRDALNKKGREYRARNIERERARAKAYHIRRPEIARKNCQTRRAKMVGVFVEVVDPAVIYKRDGGRCALCGLHVRKSDASIDHMVPLSKGGAHSYLNIQLAHLSCNQKKSTKTIGQLRLCE